jgi:hypothetical protein
MADAKDYYILSIKLKKHNTEQTLFSIRIPSYIDEFISLTKSQCEKLLHYDDYQPVFIIGNERSGTTAMINALRDCLHLSGYNEGHVFTFLNEIITTIMNSYEYRLRVMYHGHEKDLIFGDKYNYPDNALHHLSIINIINNIIRGIVENLFSTQRAWIDKTPGYEEITILPFLAMVFPKSRFIFMHRHPLEVLRSARYKFPHLEDCRIILNWNQCISNWEKVRTRLNPDQYIEIPQFELKNLSDDICIKLRNLFNSYEIDIDKIKKYLQMHHPQRTEHLIQIEDIKLNDLSVDKKTRKIIMESTSPIAYRWGYQIK